MALESVTHISDLNDANPTISDGLSEGDDHIRNIKTALTTDFPNINGVVSASDEDLSACTNFEETISATTSEVTIATGKTFDIVDDGAGLKLGGTVITTTAAQINLAKGIVFLDTPQALVTLTPSASVTWTTLDMSAVYAAAATAGAVAAMLKVEITNVSNAGITGSSLGYIRKTGSGLPANSATVVVRCGNSDDASNYTSQVNTSVVNLDSNSDFDYQYSHSGAASATFNIYLVGYYV